MALVQQAEHCLVRPGRCRGMLVGAMLTGALAACATSDVKEPLAPAAAASSSKGYLYGRFNLYGVVGALLWIRLENVDNRQTFMPFQDIGAPPYAIEIEPGTYQIKGLTKAKGGPPNMLTEIDVENAPIPPGLSLISRPIVVQPGKGYYLGDFVASSERIGLLVIPLPLPLPSIVEDTRSGSLEYRPNFGATSKWLKERYPNLANIDLQPAFGKID